LVDVSDAGPCKQCPVAKVCKLVIQVCVLRFDRAVQFLVGSPVRLFLERSGSPPGCDVAVDHTPPPGMRERLVGFRL
jgi:hypothetical protein